MVELAVRMNGWILHRRGNVSLPPGADPTHWLLAPNRELEKGLTEGLHQRIDFEIFTYVLHPSGSSQRIDLTISNHVNEDAPRRST